MYEINLPFECHGIRIGKTSQSVSEKVGFTITGEGCRLLAGLLPHDVADSTEDAGDAVLLIEDAGPGL